MRDLGSKSDKMQVILNHISNIASETHLLSLNAAIEAAGAGHFGDRFMVVADEIKRLSDSSSTASKDVVVVINEVRTSAKVALMDAQAGLERARTVAEVASNTGKVIGEIRQIAEHSLSQAHSISQLVKQIQNLTGVIKQATSAQSHASEDVLENLGGLVRVASLSAQTSTNLYNAVENLDELSNKLVTAEA
jgi:methyl-accepting chemotaxis protein